MQSCILLIPKQDCKKIKNRGDVLYFSGISYKTKHIIFDSGEVEK